MKHFISALSIVSCMTIVGVSLVSAKIPSPMGDEWPLTMNADSGQPLALTSNNIINDSSNDSSLNVIGHCIHPEWVFDFNRKIYWHHHVVQQVRWDGCHWVVYAEHSYSPTYLDRSVYAWRCTGCGAIHY